MSALMFVQSQDHTKSTIALYRQKMLMTVLTHG